jgi:hypothetical protein
MAYGTTERVDGAEEVQPLTHEEGAPAKIVMEDEDEAAGDASNRNKLVSFLMFSGALVSMVAMPSIFKSVYSATTTGTCTSRRWTPSRRPPYSRARARAKAARSTTTTTSTHRVTHH